MTFLEHCGRASGCFRFVKGFFNLLGGGGGVLFGIFICLNVPKKIENLVC